MEVIENKFMEAVPLSRRAATFLNYVRTKLHLIPAELLERTNGRSRHNVVSGETIEKIAESYYGDARVAGLLLTINRSSVMFDERGMSSIMPNTTLILPDREEVRLYKENFLLSKNRFRRYRSKPKIAVNKEFLASVASSSDEFTVQLEPDEHVTDLPGGCRIYAGATGPIGTQFSVKLQASFFDSYVTIAAYESTLGRTRRIIFKRDGGSSQLDIDLPSDVAIEMAKRDFRRNWQRYYDGYSYSAVSVSLEKLRPMLI